MLIMQLGAGDAPFFAKELQLIEYDHLKADRLVDREVQRIQRELEKKQRNGYRSTLTPLDDPNERAAIMARIREQSAGSTVPAILQNLPTGKAIAKVPSFSYGIPVSIPYLPDPDIPATPHSLPVQSKTGARLRRHRRHYPHHWK